MHRSMNPATGGIKPATGQPVAPATLQRHCLTTTAAAEGPQSWDCAEAQRVRARLLHEM